jgi:hypothetical protein
MKQRYLNTKLGTAMASRYGSDKLAAKALAGPRWIMSLVLVSILLAYVNNPPAGRNWMYYLTMTAAVLSILVTLYGWYKRYTYSKLLSVSLLADLFWVFMAVNVLRLFVVPAVTDEEKAALHADPIHKFFKVSLIVIVVLYAVLTLLFLMCFTPLSFAAIRLVVLLSNVL